MMEGRGYMAVGDWAKPVEAIDRAKKGDIIVILIAIISIIITEFASCLTSQNSRSSTPELTKPRYAINAYNTHKYFEHEDPTVITIHETFLRYGGPEEGNGYYQAGYPVRSHCIFNKKQAIQVFIKYFEEYEVEGQPSLGDITTRSNIELGFSNELAKCYPTERPRYC
jgi:hypothetical protein